MVQPRQVGSLLFRRLQPPSGPRPQSPSISGTMRCHQALMLSKFCKGGETVARLAARPTGPSTSPGEEMRSSLFLRRCFGGVHLKAHSTASCYILRQLAALGIAMSCGSWRSSTSPFLQDRRDLRERLSGGPCRFGTVAKLRLGRRQRGRPPSAEASEGLPGRNIGFSIGGILLRHMLLASSSFVFQRGSSAGAPAWNVYFSPLLRG